MSKRNTYIILAAGLIIVVIAFAAFYFFVLGGKLPGSGTGTELRSPIYPGETATTTGEGGEGGALPVTGRRPPDTEVEVPGGIVPPGGTITPGGPGGEVNVRRLGTVFRISDVPVSGATSFLPKGGSEPKVRYMERERGNLYDFDIGTLRKERISIETIPRVQEAFFVDNGTTIISRYLNREDKDLVTHRARLVVSKATSTQGMYSLEGTFLPQGISDLSVPASGNAVFFIKPAADGSVGYTASPALGQTLRIFNSPASEWLSVWADSRYVALVTKPSATVIGFSTLIDTTTGVESELVPPKKGLTVLPSPDRAIILYSENGDRGFSSKAYVRQTGFDKDLTIRTLPEKCAWSRTRNAHVLYCAVPAALVGTLPDSWYMGLVSFNDDIWRYDLDHGVSEKIASGSSFGSMGVDGYRPFVSADEDYLILMNKKDLTLWGVRVTE